MKKKTPKTHPAEFVSLQDYLQLSQNYRALEAVNCKIREQLNGFEKYCAAMERNLVEMVTGIVRPQ